MEDRHTIENFLLTGADEDFCALFEAFYPRVRRYFLLRGIEAGEAEELAQDVMVIVYQRAGAIKEKECFNGWLFKVAKNELARFWRRRQIRDRIAEMEPLEDELAEQLMTEMEVAGSSDFVEWVSYLEPAERDIIILRFVEELSYEELAVALAIPIGTVKWKLFNAKKKLAPIINALAPTKARRIN
ncbi:MAG: sigma-70 family RNA polymerase sigma factor [Chloracidobacterium sp.]|nr:sigma-70 family RNA polymerase sigma factor [Chloracidobacterium sp.]